MMPAAANAGAGKFVVMATNEGIHTPEKWAAVTADQLVSVDDNMVPTRRGEALLLRDKIVAVLCEGFHAVRVDASLDEVSAMATQAFCRIREISAGTPWQICFNSKAIGQEMMLVIRRNMLTAADLLVRTE